MGLRRLGYAFPSGGLAFYTVSFNNGYAVVKAREYFGAEQSGNAAANDNGSRGLCWADHLQGRRTGAVEIIKAF